MLPSSSFEPTVWSVQVVIRSLSWVVVHFSVFLLKRDYFLLKYTFIIMSPPSTPPSSSRTTLPYRSTNLLPSLEMNRFLKHKIQHNKIKHNEIKTKAVTLELDKANHYKEKNPNRKHKNQRPRSFTHLRVP